MDEEADYTNVQPPAKGIVPYESYPLKQDQAELEAPPVLYQGREGKSFDVYIVLLYNYALRC